jgi:predicted DNA-binding protein (UPF0251 family)
MPRTRKIRQIQRAPAYQGHMPRGTQSGTPEEVILLLEEYEAIKLCDYDLLDQAEAAALMGVSRPTLTRIYESARRKMARMLVEPCQLSFGEGQATLKIDWYTCSACNIRFTLAAAGKFCPVCGNKKIAEENRI